MSIPPSSFPGQPGEPPAGPEPQGAPVDPPQSGSVPQGYPLYPPPVGAVPWGNPAYPPHPQAGVPQAGPTFSPDGRFVWNGQQWIPVPSSGGGGSRIAIVVLCTCLGLVVLAIVVLAVLAAVGRGVIDELSNVTNGLQSPNAGGGPINWMR